jgi:para-aminobenzoate synthetase component 1
VPGDTSTVVPQGGATPASLRSVRLEALPEVASSRPIDLAESLRDVPGLVLLESARPGRNARWTYLTADPVTVLDTPAAGADPFAVARQLVAGLDRTAVADSDADADAAGAPPFLGGLAGYLAYDLGHSLERLPTLSVDDQGLPMLRLALHDWVIAWDRRTGAAWLGGRAIDGDSGRLDRRLADVRERIRVRRVERPAGDADEPAGLRFRSSLDRAAYETGVEAIRSFIANGDIYQANLTRRLEATFSSDPWPLYRRLRTGDPSLFSAYVDIGRATGSVGHPGPRAILSASPEPFLSVDRSGAVKTNPIKGTRPRGRSREEDRALACELLSSGKDRAENVMIVDVLRNDLGRVCRPGSVRVPRLCRLERTAAVQHLVSTVTGQLAPGRDAFDLLAASFPGGSITGAPKIRAMELLEELEPVRRGPYTGALGWIGPDGAMATSILIRTFVADGSRLSLNVGGGITYQSDPAAEWEETVAKARGPLAAIGGSEVAAG